MQNENGNQMCSGCQADSGYDVRPVNYHIWSRCDAYGIFTGIYCDDCYDSGNSKLYPYVKDSYNHREDY